MGAAMRIFRHPRFRWHDGLFAVIANACNGKNQVVIPFLFQ